MAGASVNGGSPTSAHSTDSFEEHTDNGVRILDKVIPVQFINEIPISLQPIPTGRKKYSKRALISQTNVTLPASVAPGAHLISLGYYSNTGLVLNNDYRRFSARINNSFQPFNNKVKGREFPDPEIVNGRW